MPSPCTSNVCALAVDDLAGVFGAFHDGLVRCLSKLGRSEAGSARDRKVKLAPAGLG